MACVASGFIPCPQEGLPSNFCCPPDTSCIALAANTTALCCPQGSDCSLIRGITCDITAQNASRNPQSTLKTTNLNGVLPRCGLTCCPFGYSCNAQKECEKRLDQREADAVTTITAAESGTSSSIAPALRSTDSTNSLSATGPASISGSSTTTPLTLPTNITLLSPAPNVTYRPTVIGVSVSMSLLAVILFLGFVFWRWRKWKTATAQERFEKAESCGDEAMRNRSIRIELEARYALLEFPAPVEMAELPATPVVRRGGDFRSGNFF